MLPKICIYLNLISFSEGAGIFIVVVTVLFPFSFFKKRTKKPGYSGIEALW